MVRETKKEREPVAPSTFLKMIVFTMFGEQFPDDPCPFSGNPVFFSFGGLEDPSSYPGTAHQTL